MVILKIQGTAAGWGINMALRQDEESIWHYGRMRNQHGTKTGWGINTAIQEGSQHGTTAGRGVNTALRKDGETRHYKTGNQHGRMRLKCDDTRAETRFRLSAKRTSPFKSAGASIQSTTGSRRVRISGNSAGYTMFRGSVKSTGYPLHSPVSPSLPLPCVTVCHHISIGLYYGRTGINTALW
jgi:hypothetical protein